MLCHDTLHNPTRIYAADAKGEGEGEGMCPQSQCVAAARQ